MNCTVENTHGRTISPTKETKRKKKERKERKRKRKKRESILMLQLQLIAFNDEIKRDSRSRLE
jgi:hypothetical protein